MFMKLPSLCLAVAFFVIAALSACGPANTNAANPTVRGDNSTIAGDKDATTIRKQQ
jgi:hypothetical protein